MLLHSSIASEAADDFDASDISDTSDTGLRTPHCWGNQVQKVDTEAKFCVILFVIINALIWCNFESNWCGSFWDNPIYLIAYPHGQDLGFFFEKSKVAIFIVIQLCYIVLWPFFHYKWATIEEVDKMIPVWE